MARDDLVGPTWQGMADAVFRALQGALGKFAGRRRQGEQYPIPKLKLRGAGGRVGNLVVGDDDDGPEETWERAEERFRTFWVAEGTVHSALLDLIRMLYSMPASGAGLERVFSPGGRLDDRLRGKLSSRRLERLLVIQQYLSRHRNAIRGLVTDGLRQWKSAPE